MDSERIQCQYCGKWFKSLGTQHYKGCAGISNEELRDRIVQASKQATIMRKRMYNRDRDARRLYGGKKLRVGPVHAQGEHEDNDNHCYHEDPCDPDEVNDIYDCQKESAECDDSLACKTRLNMFERALIEAVPRLPKKVGDSLIKASWDILDGNLSFGRGIEDFNDFLRTESGREDMVQTLGLTVCGNDCVIFHIADAKALLQECLLKVKDIKTRPESATIPGSGARVYGEVAWGDWMLDTWVRNTPWLRLLPIAFYSDKTLSRKGPKTLYPVNLFFPSAAIEDRFTQNAYRCIGHIPEPQPQGHLLPKKGMVMKNLKKWLMYTSLHLILEPFKNLSHTGVRLVNTKGETKTYFPIPVFYAADLLEYQTIFGISAGPNDMDSYPDPAYLVRRRRLGKSIDTMPTRRSEILFQKRLDASRRFKDPEKAKEMLKEFSYDPLLLYTPEADTFGKQGKSVVTYYLGQGDASKGRIPSLPLAGFHLTNCFDLVVPDTLHTLHSGVGSYICNFNLKSASLLKTCMEMSGKHQANLLSKMSASIDESSPLREYSLPSVKFEPTHR
ncbi:hypothetical protein PSENEW3n2_00005409 [Picochlorum sp. SENEW3]|nr:hypothetical protein PSENEW3n2_00005409 [Picochlorum sp. SENEW3]WPT17405.1 hypothetical protein PSENEW3_00005409 [Picochlorum sp. SENEW3]